MAFNPLNLLNPVGLATDPVGTLVSVFQPPPPPPPPPGPGDELV